MLAVALVCLAPAGPARAAKQPQGAKEEQVRFQYGTDISSWYWSHQVNQEATTPVGLPPPVPPVSQRVVLPNPQRPDTLPVGVFEGQQDRMSAIKFDLVERGVTPGSKIQKLVLRIEESQDRNEYPSYRPDAAKIQACRIIDVLSPGENERFEDRPQHAESDCAEGKRETPQGKPPAWTFDLTEVARPWGSDPFAENNGVMLLGVLQNQGAQETWQVNLKIPARDNASTAEADEYQQTKDRVQVTLAFVPGEDPFGQGSGAGAGSLDGGGTTAGSGTITGSSPSSFGSSAGTAPSTDLTGGGSPVVSPTEAPTPVAAQPVAQASPEPRLPAVVWLLIPLGLLALSAVRSVVMEPAGGPRADGVIAAIRSRNAERRGGPLREVADPMARAMGVIRTTVLTVGRGVRDAARGLGRAAGSIVGRKAS